MIHCVVRPSSWSVWMFNMLLTITFMSSASSHSSQSLLVDMWPWIGQPQRHSSICFLTRLRSICRALSMSPEVGHSRSSFLARTSSMTVWSIVLWCTTPMFVSFIPTCDLGPDLFLTFVAPVLFEPACKFLVACRANEWMDFSIWHDLFQLYGP